MRDATPAVAARRGGGRRPGCWTCWGCPRLPMSASSPARRWRTSPAWPRPATRCSADVGLGRRRGRAGRGPAGPRPRRRGAARLRRPGAALPGARADRRSPADDAGTHRRRRARAAARRGRRPDDRLPAGGKPALGGVRPVRCGQSTSRTGTAPGCTSTARSDCGRRPRRAAAAGRRDDRADSWATDAHKTLNVPYDCGIAVVADPAPLYGAMGVHTSYLIRSEQHDPDERVPELSRRARGSRSGPRCGRWGAPGSRSWSTGLPRRPVGSLRGSRRSTARRSSTTSSTPRCACLR